MFFIYACIVISNSLQSVTAKLYSRKNDNAMSFNAIKSISALVLFLVMGINSLSLHTGTVLYGALYGLMMCVSMYSGYKALSEGPMSLTSLIVSFSLVMPLLYGVTVCNEKLNVLKITGLIFVVIAIICANINNTKTGGKSLGAKWALYVALTFISNGFCSILQKRHQTEYKSMYCMEFMLFAMTVCSLIFLIILLREESVGEILKSGGKKYAVISGVSNAVTGYLTIRCAGFENASILFPAISAGTILCSILCGVFIFKEKLKYNHIISILCGVLAVVFLKL